ncbi:hypothetical protein WAI453_011178 [Rhynchosporium graminicola]|uniref:SAP domain-containing protein n=1 Tax=Rhynchosporium graminicola TaxID=2792576 RepID=A0A1E1KEC9_9HELO|nr:uncharacterized protein RCO7_05891 [Rhynchosporium commune]
MEKLPNFHEWTKDELLEECDQRGLSRVGAKNDLMKQLYPNEIQKRRSAYERHKARGFAQDPEGIRLLSELQNLKRDWRLAARHQHEAENDYVQTRLKRAENDREESMQSANTFAQDEHSNIKRRLKVHKQRRVARKAARETAREVLKKAIQKPVREPVQEHFNTSSSRDISMKPSQRSAIPTHVAPIAPMLFSTTSTTSTSAPASARAPASLPVTAPTSSKKSGWALLGIRSKAPTPKVRKG